MAVHFELLITNEPSKRSQCLENIRKEFKKKPKPLFDSYASANTSLEGFYNLKLSIKEKDAWSVANKLMTIEGVEDVDPEVQQANDLIELEKDEREIGHVTPDDKPPANWIHDNSRFREAVSYAIEQGQGGNGAYAGGESGIKIAQMDTGYSNHPEISKIRKEEGWNYVFTFWDRVKALLFDRKPAIRVARDRLRTFRPFKWPAHGTATAAIIIGQYTGNKGIKSDLKDRTDGVFPHVDLIPYRISETIISFNNKVAHAALQAIKDGCKGLDQHEERLHLFYL
ncbi:MAG: S8 family serine peptidase [Bacteroidota bacterium]